MNAHGGTWQWGTPLFDRAFAADLERSLTRRGLDGGGRYADGGLCMAFRAPLEGPRRASASQPLRSPEGCVVAFDGRLDNSADLVSVLRSRLQDSQSDAAIVAAAYSAWGPAAFERLIGDWALVLWDSRQRCLLLARDFSGVRPLYYRHTAARITWASELETFLRLQPGRYALNDEYLATFLFMDPPADTTPYDGVRAVPPGSCVMVTADRVKVFTHWQPDPADSIVYRRDSDYEDHFRELFRAAVRSRANVRGPVWAELSGGLDSSSIVCMADALTRSGDLEAPVATVSYVYDESPGDDERHYIELVESQRGVKGRHFVEADYATFTIDERTPFFARPIPAPGRPLAVASAMNQAGARVLLTGTGGDAVMWSSTRACPHIADFCGSGHWQSLHEAIVQQCGMSSRTYFDVLWADALQPMIRRRATRRPTPPEWVRATRPDDARHDRPSNGTRGLSFAQRTCHDFISSALNLCATQFHRTVGHASRSFPFLDRRLVQFMLAVPFDQKVRGGVTRSLHRRAMTGILPAEIATRQTKGGTQESRCRAVRREWSRLSAMFGPDARVVQRCYITAPAASALLQQLRAGLEVDLFASVRLLGLEVWLRHLEATYPEHIVTVSSEIPACDRTSVPAMAGGDHGI